MLDELPSWTTTEEREQLAKLAQTVPAGGTILEIGALYGGTTAVLAMNAPKCKVITIDNFSWTPPGFPKVSQQLLKKNLAELNIENVVVHMGDSEVLLEGWRQPLELAFIDGGHSYQFVYADLCAIAPHAEVVALHDYRNPVWPDIEAAITQFLADNSDWHLAEVVGQVAVLRRN